MGELGDLILAAFLILWCYKPFMFVARAVIHKGAEAWKDAKGENKCKAKKQS